MSTFRGFGKFAPEKLEDGPGDFGVLGAKVGEAGEGNVGLKRDREIFWRRARESHIEEVGVGARNIGEKGRKISILDVSRWYSALEGGIIRMTNCEVHC